MILKKKSVENMKKAIHCFNPLKKVVDTFFLGVNCIYRN